MKQQSKAKNGTSSKKNSKVVMVNNQKKKKKAFKVFSAFALIIVLCVGIYLLFTLPYFSLSDVNLNETQKYSKQDILQKLNITIGKNVFIEFFTCNRKNVSTLPYVEDVKLSLKLPNKIDMKVVERAGKYVAYNKEDNSFYELSKDGYILDKIDINSKKEDELLVIGISFENDVILGSKINDIDLSKFTIFKKIKNEFENSKLNGSITKVNFENSLTTITINDKLNVIFPNDTDLEYKMSFLKGILSKIGEDSVGVIDMTKTNPTYSSF